MHRRTPLLAVGLLLSLVTCRDGMEPQLHMAPIAVAPVLPSEALLADFGLTIDHVRFVVVRPPLDTLADTTLALPPDATELTLDLRVPLVRRAETLSISVIALSGTTPLFTGTSLVQVPTPPPPPEIPLTTYIGPAADSIVILPRSPFIRLGDSLRFQALGFNAGVPVTQFFVAWSTSDSALASINHLGVVHAPAGRSFVRVRARTPSGASDSVTATFTPAATQLVLVAGNGQSQTVGSPLPVALEVEAHAADGLSVGGVPVRFRAISGGGAVADTLVVTDGLGRARTPATLGALSGTQTFEASVAGLAGSPVAFNAVAFAGAATQLVPVAGDLQSTVVATAVATAPAVRVLDQFGNPVAGASVTFSANAGGGSVTGATQLTNAAGVATVGSWTLGPLVGANALTATASGVTPVMFAATGIAGAATAIVKLPAGDLQSAIVNTTVPNPPEVRIVDQFGNPVSGATLNATVTSGGGSITNAAPVSDATGVASVGGWRLGTLAGANAVVVSGTGLAGSPITFTATGLVAVASQMAVFAGDQQTALAGAALSFPPVVRVSDQFGNPVAGVTVSFVVASGGGSPSTPVAATSDTAGLATGPTWTLGTVAGLNTLTATAAGLPTVTFTAEGLVSAASSITMGSGNLQSGVVATTLPTAYSVVVRSLAGAPVQGVPVSWAAAGGSITPTLDTTDASGISTAVRTLGTVAGTQTATASVGGLAGSPVTFSATALPDIPAQLVKVSADPQSATVATTVAAAPSVRVVDRFNNPVPGAIVGFSVTSGGGGIAAGADTSNAVGMATGGAWTLGTVAGTLNNALSVSATGVPTVSFRASSVADIPDHLTFLTEPVRSLAGDTIAPAVQVAIQDKFSNVVVPAKDVVTLGFGVTPDTAAKLLNPTAAAVNGVATFPDLAIDSAGVGYTLIATAGSLASAPTQPFVVGGVIAAVKDDRLDPVAAAFSPATGLVYIPGANNTISVFDPGKGLITPFPVLQNQPFGVALNVPANRTYVTTFATLVGFLTVLDAKNPSTILATVPLAGEAKGVAVDEATGRIFVAVAGDPQKALPPTLAVVDSTDNRVVASIPFPDGSAAGIGVAFNPNDRFVYVAIPTQGVGVFDPVNLKFVRMISIVGAKGAAGTYGVAVDTRANLLYATNRADNTLSIVELSTGKDVRLQVGLAPEGVGVDADRGVAYVGNSGDSTVSFIDWGRRAVIATLIVGPAPKAAAVNPLTGQVYVPTFTDDQVRVIQP